MQGYETALEFLRAVLPSTGRFVAAVKAPKKGMIHHFFETPEALAHFLVQRDGQGKEVYYAMSGYGLADERTQENVQAVKSLWLDLDVKPGQPDKGYEDLDEALGSLDAFCESGFPQPTYVVQSGYGAHAYWLFTNEQPKAQWQILADTFQRSWQAFGLKCDPVSADAARVLRSPGTHNRKRDTPAPVSILEGSGELFSVAELFDALKAFAPPPATAATKALLLSAADLMSGLQNRQAFIAPIVSKCRQMAGIAKDKGESCSEPLWYATVQLCRHLEDGPQAAHYLSSGHPDYAPDAVDAKLEQLESKDIGPTTCERFKSVNPKGCEGCAFKITSPIQLGEKDPEPVQEVVVVQTLAETESGAKEVQAIEMRPPVDYPEGFIRTSEGLKVKVKGDDGIERHLLVFPGAFYPTRVYRAGPTDPALMVDFFAYRQDKGQTYFFTAPNEQLSEPKDVRRLLKRYVNVTMEAANHLHKLIDRMTNSIQRAEREGISARQMGWQFGHHETERNFVWGNNLYQPPPGAIVTPNVSVSPSVAQLGKFCRPRGSFDGAMDAASLYIKAGGEMHQFIHLFGLAGIFAPFTGPQNFAMLSLVNRVGGEGKTTNCDAAMSMWFDPALTRNTPSDTDNSLFNTMSVRGSLPFHLDEATNMRADRMVNFVYTSSQGREKARMEQSGAKQRDPLPPWKCPVLLSSNVSVRQLVRAARGDAAALDARLIELRYNRLDLNPAERQTIERAFYDNYGWVGPVALQRVMLNLDGYANAYSVTRAQLAQQAGSDSVDRFWLNTVVSVLCAAKAMNALRAGTSRPEYNLQRLFEFSVDLLKRQRSDSKDDAMEASDILARFLSLNVNRILVGYQTSPGTDGVTRLATLTEQLRGGSELVGRSQLHEEALYISALAFREFCTTYGHDYRSFVQEAREVGLLTERVLVGTKDGKPVYAAAPEKYSLGRGTPMATTPSRVLAFNLRHKDLAAHMQDARSAVIQSQNIRPIYAADQGGAA